MVTHRSLSPPSHRRERGDTYAARVVFVHQPGGDDVRPLAAGLEQHFLLADSVCDSEGGGVDGDGDGDDDR